MDEPPKYLLVFAFLGEEVRKAKEGSTYAEIERSWGIKKPNLITLNQGGTLGVELLYRIADCRWGGSVDAIGTAASTWWRKIDAERQAEIRQWAAAIEARRAGTKVEETPADREEIERYRRGMSRDSRPKTEGVTRSSPPSGAHRHRR